jgi:hypothetical protein
MGAAVSRVQTEAVAVPDTCPNQQSTTATTGTSTAANPERCPLIHQLAWLLVPQANPIPKLTVRVRSPRHPFQASNCIWAVARLWQAPSCLTQGQPPARYCYSRGPMRRNSANTQ